MLNFVLPAAPVQLPFNLHLRSSSLREKPRDARFDEGAGGERDICYLVNVLNNVLMCACYRALYLKP